GGSNAPLTFAGLSDVNVAGVTDGKFVKYDLASNKWVPGTVREFAQAALPTCTTGQVLTGDGTNLSCVSDAGGADDPIDLVELGDVRTGPNTNLNPSDNDFLRYSTAAGRWVAVQDKLAGTLTSGSWCRFDGTHVTCDRGAPSQCATGEVLGWNSSTNAFVCNSVSSTLGLGSMAFQNSDAISVTGGTIDGTVIGGTTPAAGTFTNLRVTGNLYVSGTQSIDGVSFLNGGVMATGTVTATHFVGDGSQLTGINAGSLAAAGIAGSVQFKDPSTGSISGTQHIVWDETAKNLNVQGTVQVAGTGSEGCNATTRGQMRMVEVTTGDFRLQVCRP
ncbi:MAG: hypothetical protein DI585_01165, partial [Pseudomonas fluorescens]